MSAPTLWPKLPCWVCIFWPKKYLARPNVHMHKWKHSIHLCPLTAMAQSDMPITRILNERTSIASFLEKIGFCIYFLRLCHFFLLLSPFKSFTISVWLWLDALFIFASCSLLGEKSNNIPLHLFTFNATVIWKIGNFLFGEGKCVFFSAWSTFRKVSLCHAIP